MRGVSSFSTALAFAFDVMVLERMHDVLKDACLFAVDELLFREERDFVMSHLDKWPFADLTFSQSCLEDSSEYDALNDLENPTGVACRGSAFRKARLYWVLGRMFSHSELNAAQIDDLLYEISFSVTSTSTLSSYLLSKYK